MCLVMKMGWFYVLDKKFEDSIDLLKFEDSIDLLLLIDNDKSHYVHIKDFDRFMFHKIKTKNGFVRVIYRALVVKVY